MTLALVFRLTPPARNYGAVHLPAGQVDGSVRWYHVPAWVVRERRAKRARQRRVSGGRVRDGRHTR